MATECGESLFTCCVQGLTLALVTFLVTVVIYLTEPIKYHRQVSPSWQRKTWGQGVWWQLVIFWWLRSRDNRKKSKANYCWSPTGFLSSSHCTNWDQVFRHTTLGRVFHIHPIPSLLLLHIGKNVLGRLHSVRYWDYSIIATLFL